MGELHVANEATKLLEHIDEMRERLRQIALTEQSLVKDLADSLKTLDQQLLLDVRQAAADHQARRGSILNALEDLADTMGMFRLRHQGDAAQPVGIPQTVAKPKPVVAITQPVATTRPAPCLGRPQYRSRSTMGHQYSPTAGDWRQAAKNASLADDLEVLLNGLNGKGPKN
jgi:hypothetical protein